MKARVRAVTRMGCTQWGPVRLLCVGPQWSTRSSRKCRDRHDWLISHRLQKWHIYLTNEEKYDLSWYWDQRECVFVGLEKVSTLQYNERCPSNKYSNRFLGWFHTFLYWTSGMLPDRTCWRDGVFVCTSVSIEGWILKYLEVSSTNFARSGAWVKQIWYWILI